MQDKLMWCYYNGMTIAEAVAFIKDVYGLIVKEVSIKTAVKRIKDYDCKDWL